MSYPSGPQMPYGPPPPQPPKPGMSTGAKVGLGVGLGCGIPILLLIMLVGCAAFLSSPSSEGTSSSTPAAVEATEEAEEVAVEDEEPAEEAAVEETSDIVLTATHAGTAGDIVDDTVYTVLDITVENNSSDDLEVNPIYFSVILTDGTVVNDWADAIFADIDSIDAVTLSPGQRVEGQIAVVGDDLDIAEVEMTELFGLQDPVTATVS